MAHELDPLAPHAEPDYVRCFAALTQVEMELRRRGPSPHLLLRRGMLHTALGNHVAALEAAQDAVARCPREAEAHYQEGMAWVWMARIHCGGARQAPGCPRPTARPLEVLLRNAHDAFCAALHCAPQDEEAEAAAAWVEHLMARPEQVVQALGPAS